MFSYTMIERKPSPRYLVELGDKSGIVYKQPWYVTRSRRWELVVTDHKPGDLPIEPQYFTSRRSAFHFFRTGEKFKTAPVYLERGKTQKRIR